MVAERSWMREMLLSVVVVVVAAATLTVDNMSASGELLVTQQDAAANSLTGGGGGCGRAADGQRLCCQVPPEFALLKGKGKGSPGGWRSTVVERRSLTGELSLSCARPAADG